MRYAIAFTTFQWSDYHARQYRRIRDVVPRPDDLYVIVDETRGPVAGLPPDLARLPITTEQVLRLVGNIPRVRGFVGLDGVMWWNGDLATYTLFDAHPEYDLCLTMDYDACLNLDLDRIMARVDGDGLDLLCHPHADMAGWVWAAAHRSIYSERELRGALVAVTIMSRPAASYLRALRRLHALEHQVGLRRFWPFSEAFVPTELARGGFRCGELGSYADVSRLRWRPVFPESGIGPGVPPGITHPVRPDGDDGRYSVQL